MKINVGNAPCSWGIIENVAGEREGYKKVLDEMVETGYAGTELGDWGFMPIEPELLKHELGKRNLEMTGSWVNVYLSYKERYKESLANCLRTAKLLSEVCKGKPYINLGDEVYEIPHRTEKAGRIQKEDMMDTETRKIFMANLNELKNTVESETGVSLLFHHHIGTWIETESEIDTMLNESDINICFDSGHCTFGGGDALASLKKYRQRIGTIHFKDCDPRIAEESRKNEWNAFTSLEHGIFPELGKGTVDFQGIVDFLKSSDYNGWVTIEQDIIPGMGDPKAGAGRNREYVRKTGL